MVTPIKLIGTPNKDALNELGQPKEHRGRRFSVDREDLISSSGDSDNYHDAEAGWDRAHGDIV